MWKNLHQSDALEFFTNSNLVYEGNESMPPVAWHGEDLASKPKPRPAPAQGARPGPELPNQMPDNSADDLGIIQPAEEGSDDVTAPLAADLDDNDFGEERPDFLRQVVDGGEVWQKMQHTVPAKTIYVPLAERIEAVRNVYYSPSERFLPESERLPAGVTEPRDLQAEGGLRYTVEFQLTLAII